MTTKWNTIVDTITPTNTSKLFTSCSRDRGKTTPSNMTVKPVCSPTTPRCTTLDTKANSSKYRVQPSPNHRRSAPRSCIRPGPQLVAEALGLNTPKLPSSIRQRSRFKPRPLRRLVKNWSKLDAIRTTSESLACRLLLPVPPTRKPKKNTATSHSTPMWKVPCRGCPVGWAQTSPNMISTLQSATLNPTLSSPLLKLSGKPRATAKNGPCANLPSGLESVVLVRY